MKSKHVLRAAAVTGAAFLLSALAACDKLAPDFAPAPAGTLTAAATSAVLMPPTSAAGNPTRAPGVTVAATRAVTASVTLTGTTPAAATATATLAGTPTPLATPSQTFRYIVQADDTLSSIAARFKTSVEMLVMLNNLPGDLIVVGQQLVIPGAPPTATSTPRPPTPTSTPRPTPRTYTVRLGDTLSAIAKRYGTTVAIIMQYNGLKSEVVVPGQVLRIP